MAFTNAAGLRSSSIVSSVPSLFAPPVDGLRRRRTDHKIILCHMGLSRGEALKTGAGVVVAAIALTFARAPIYAASSHTPVAAAVVATPETTTTLLLPTNTTSKYNILSTNNNTTTTTTTTTSAQKCAVLVAGTSLHDLSRTPTQPGAPQEKQQEVVGSASKRGNINNTYYDEGEFALSVRLCTACAIGVLMGGMSMKMREVVITSLTACLSTIYAIVPAGLESCAIASLSPSIVAPFAVGLGSLLFSFGSYAIRKPAALRSKNNLRRLAINAGVFASAAGAGSACATGQALPAVAFYLLAMSLCKDVTRRQKEKKLLALSARSTTTNTSNNTNSRHREKGALEIAAYSPTTTHASSPQR